MSPPQPSNKAIDEVFRLIGSGQLMQAEQRCSELLNDDPDDVNLVALHGALLLKLGNHDKAEASLQKAIALEPRFAKPYEDLGRLFLSRNEPGRAADYFSRAIELDDSQASAFGGLASALVQLGEEEEARAVHEKYLERSPLARALLEAEQSLGSGDTLEAEKICNGLLKREPDNTRVLRMLARIASVDGRPVVAEQLLRRIIALSPDEYLPHNELGRFLVEQSRFSEAIELFLQAAAIDGSVADNFRMLGDAQALMGQSEEALSTYRHALQLNPGELQALAGLGHMLRIAGDREGAITAYAKCAESRPEFGDAWWSLASFRNYQLSDDQLVTIQEQLASGNLEAASEIGMHFALARAAEAREDFATAWKEYGQGNTRKRQLIQYDPVQTEVTHDAIIDLFDSAFLDKGASSSTSRVKPIFIVGMPRSGSTLIEQVLASHSQVEGAGELPYVVMLSSSLGGQRTDGLRYPEVLAELTPAQFTALGEAYLYHSGVHRKLDLPCFTDKMPANFSHVGLIHMMLPNASIIDARRHPMATCVANYRQLYAQGKNQTYDLVEFAEYLLEYHRMMAHWQANLPGRVLTVQYEDVVADLEREVHRILDYCELPWEDACLEFHRNPRPVNTASAEQVREPLYRDAVNFWKNYESYLGPVQDILEPLIGTGEGSVGS